MLPAAMMPILIAVPLQVMMAGPGHGSAFAHGRTDFQRLTGPG
jgi:hypothetical protein